MQSTDIIVRDKGKFEVIPNMGSDYPGMDIEFMPNKDHKGTNPRILFEYPDGGKLRLLIWGDPNSEDPNKEIIFEGY